MDVLKELGFCTTDGSGAQRESSSSSVPREVLKGAFLAAKATAVAVAAPAARTNMSEARTAADIVSLVWDFD